MAKGAAGCVPWSVSSSRISPTRMASCSRGGTSRSRNDLPITSPDCQPINAVAAEFQSVMSPASLNPTNASGAVPRMACRRASLSVSRCRLARNRPTNARASSPARANAANPAHGSQSPLPATGAYNTAEGTANTTRHGVPATCAALKYTGVPLTRTVPEVRVFTPAASAGLDCARVDRARIPLALTTPPSASIR